jgi:hypothetical protein
VFIQGVRTRKAVTQAMVITSYMGYRLQGHFKDMGSIADACEK